MKSKTSQEFFDNLYQHHSDPWNFYHDDYEQQRYQIIFDALKSQRYELAFEPGCSVGVLTKKLSDICEQVEAIDISPIATKIAQDFCHDKKNIHIRCATLADYSLQPQTDLIVLSEVGYYFDPDRLKVLIERLLETSSKQLTLVASHWLGESADHIISGDQVHACINSFTTLNLLHAYRDHNFRLEIWKKKP